MSNEHSNANPSTYVFSNQREAERFARAQGGPILIDIAHAGRGAWIVTITAKDAQ